MSDTGEFSELDDPAFLAERRRVREELEHLPEHDVSPDLAARFQRLGEEFIRRARAAWARLLSLPEDGGGLPVGIDVG